MFTKLVCPLLVFFMLCPATVCTVATAQSTATAVGVIGGTVKDPTGAVLKGAQVVLQPSGTSTATDAQGNFSIRDLKPGTYTTSISYLGFGKFSSTVVVQSGQETLINAVLTVSGNAERVEVTANL